MRNGKNALFLINHAGKAGTERYVYTLISGAPRFGYTPFFAFNEKGLLSERIENLGVRSFQLKMRNPYDAGAVRKLRDICQEYNIDVVHTNYLRENYIALFVKKFFIKKLKIVHTNHFVVSNNFLVRTINRILTPGNHRIISVCEIGAKKLKENGFAKEKITVIHNAVDPSLWDPSAEASMYNEIRMEKRKELGIADNETVFLCASRFAHDKGHMFYIEGINRFFNAGNESEHEDEHESEHEGEHDCKSEGEFKSEHESGHESGHEGEHEGEHNCTSESEFKNEHKYECEYRRNARFVLAGDGPLLEAVKGRVSALKLGDRIIFTGYMEDIRPLFYAADVYVNPSEHEALSFLILEALASGLPVIATDMGGNSDIINERSGCGILIKYGDADTLCAALDKLFKDEAYRAGMKPQALAVIKEKFCVDLMLEKTFQTFD